MAAADLTCAAAAEVCGSEVIKARLNKQDNPDERIVFIGLSDNDIKDMRFAGSIEVNTSELGFGDLSIVIVAGTTNDDCITKLNEMLDN